MGFGKKELIVDFGKSYVYGMVGRRVLVEWVEEGWGVRSGDSKYIVFF